MKPELIELLKMHGSEVCDVLLEGERHEVIWQIMAREARDVLAGGSGEGVPKWGEAFLRDKYLEPGQEKIELPEGVLKADLKLLAEHKVLLAEREADSKQALPLGISEILNLLREFAAIRDGEGLIVASGQWRSRFGSEMRGDLEIFDMLADEALHLAKELLRERETEGC